MCPFLLRTKRFSLKSLFFSADRGNDLVLVQTRPVKAFETYVAFSAELELSLEDSYLAA